MMNNPPTREFLRKENRQFYGFGSTKENDSEVYQDIMYGVVVCTNLSMSITSRHAISDNCLLIEGI
jgi:hypothetical protein